MGGGGGGVPTAPPAAPPSSFRASCLDPTHHLPAQEMLRNPPDPQTKKVKQRVEVQEWREKVIRPPLAPPTIATPPPPLAPKRSALMRGVVCTVCAPHARDRYCCGAGFYLRRALPAACTSRIVCMDKEVAQRYARLSSTGRPGRSGGGGGGGSGATPQTPPPPPPSQWNYADGSCTSQ